MTLRERVARHHDPDAFNEAVRIAPYNRERRKAHALKFADAAIAIVLEEAAKDGEFALGQLRHAYAHMSEGRPTGKHKEFADGLIAPAIRWIERLRALQDKS